MRTQPQVGTPGPAAGGAGPVDSGTDHGRMHDLTSERGRAVRLRSRAWDLIAAGRWAEALTDIDEAVTILRANPPVDLPELVDLLNYRGEVLSGLGRPDDGVAAAEEAVAASRELAATDPVPLATSLHNLGIRLAQAGRDEDALAVALETLPLWQQQAQSGTLDDVAALAAAYLSAGNRLAAVGEEARALAPLGEAVRLRRLLVEHDPAYLGPLAYALLDHAGQLAECSGWVEAADASTEAATILRDLAAADRGYRSDAARALNNRVACLIQVGRRAEAVEAIDELAALRRELAADDPARHLPDLATTLRGLAAERVRLGEWALALPAAEEATAVLVELVRDEPARAADLWDLSDLKATILDHLGRTTEAADLRAQLHGTPRHPDTGVSGSRT
ncbi:hypothetical protein GCM10007977_089680 [Dactylosporangium sucinum]|uniref:Tetratricopeptide repeat protein n=2 Tax=Dactylosporangium sucinum TaxID=1424081 RepID=A0A917UAY7_9ACTN|nr:hypothetical protein GCM10007977_089680 [Dactylosporangium sucinum]